MKVLAEILEEYGFYDNSYMIQDGKYRNPMFYAILPDLYCGWQSTDSAPIIRRVPWGQVFKNKQRIIISDEFKRIPPAHFRSPITTGRILASFLYNVFKDCSPQHNNTNQLEFQHLLAMFNGGNQRPTTLADVGNFNYSTTYVILDKDNSSGYFALCKEDDLTYYEKNSRDKSRLIFIHATLFLYVDHIQVLWESISSWNSTNQPQTSGSSLPNTKSNHTPNRKRKTIKKKNNSKEDLLLMKRFADGERSKLLLYNLLGIFLKKYIRVEGRNKDYKFSWNSGHRVVVMTRSEAIYFLTKTLIKSGFKHEVQL